MAAQAFSPCPVRRLTGIWKFDKPALRRVTAASIPGHLLHYILKGSYTLILGGRPYRVGKGDVLYYYETEAVEWIGGPNPVSFYSVGFLAPDLSPLPPDRRRMAAPAGCGRLFHALYRTSLLQPGHEREFRCFGLLCEILAAVFAPENTKAGTADEGNPWWKAERALRAKRAFQPDVDDLIRISGKSYSSLQRLTRTLFGIPPLARVREIRIAEAKGLLRYSDLSVTAISDYLDYRAVCDFSREFSACCGQSPSRFRQECASSQ